LPVAVGVKVLLLLAAVYLPGLRILLETVPLTVPELAVAVAAAAVPAATALLVARR